MSKRFPLAVREDCSESQSLTFSKSSCTITVENGMSLLSLATSVPEVRAEEFSLQVVHSQLTAFPCPQTQEQHYAKGRMVEPGDDSYRCPRCKAEVQADDDFCPRCGGLFTENLVCEAHADRSAAGVCIICVRPCCEKCGSKSAGRFLCATHSMYEIYEGMVRVFGSSDAVQVDYAKSCLESDGLHPFVFSRKASPLSIGGPDYTLFNASGEYDGHIINEFKLMVPCQEVPRAEEKLRELEFIK